MKTAALSKKPSLVRDDLSLFLRDLKSGEQPITLLVAPAAWAVLPDLPHILGFFRGLGLRAFFPVLPYADICAWVYYRFLQANVDTCLVSSACAGMNHYMDRNYPAAAPKHRAYSPLLCAARYLKTYRQTAGAFAFLSPCSLKHLEFSVRGEELVRYNITIDTLSAWIGAGNIEPEKYPALKTGGDEGAIDFSRGLTVASFGSISASLACLFPGLRRLITQGAGQATEFFTGTLPSENYPRIFEPYACVGGCANGSGVRRTLKNRSRDAAAGDRNFLLQNEGATGAAILERFNRFDTELDLKDFCYDS